MGEGVKPSMSFNVIRGQQELKVSDKPSLRNFLTLRFAQKLKSYMYHYYETRKLGIRSAVINVIATNCESNKFVIKKQ